MIDHHGSLLEPGEHVHVELPLDPADLALAAEPEPAWMRVDVVEVDRHVPSLVRVVFPTDYRPEPPVAPDAAIENEEGDR